MAQSLSFQDGDQVTVNMKIKPKGNASPRDLHVMANHIIDLNVKQMQGSAAVATIRLYDKDFDSLEDVIFSSSLLDNNPNNQGQTGQPVLAVTFGWANGSMSRPYDLTIHKYSSKYHLGRGTEIELQGVGAPSLLFTRGNTSFQKGEDLETIVRRVINDRRFAISVERGAAELSQRQNGMTGLAFLQGCAASGSFVNASRNTNYTAWIDESAIGPVVYLRCSTSAPPTATTWNYLYGIDKEGQVKDWEVDLQAAALFGLGAGGMRAVIVDKGSKSAETRIVNQRTLPGVTGEGLIVPEASNAPAPLRVAFEDRNSALSYASDKWARLNTTNVKGRLTVLGNPSISPSDLVNVIVLAGKEGVSDITDIHPTSGSYNILSVEHNITLGDFTTTVECVRRGNLVPGVGGTVKSTGSSNIGSVGSSAIRGVLGGAASAFGNAAFSNGSGTFVDATFLRQAADFQQAFGNLSVTSEAILSSRLPRSN